MDDKKETGSLFEALSHVDTPTICNALEIACGKRRAEGFTRKTMVMPKPELGAFVGRARTATISATERKTKGDVGNRIEYYKYVASPGVVVVIEDLDDPSGLGAFWGEVNSTIHAGLGVAGVVTNGSVRDLDMLCPGFPILAGEISPSHAFVDIEEMDVKVSINSMEVSPNDIVHADRHGAVVIPDKYLEALPDAIEKLLMAEKKVLDAAKADGFSVEKLEQAMREARDLH